VASNIQEHLWPEKSIQGFDWEIQGVCQTATELGGDHYDWLQLSDGRILLTIGDVTGHGIGAAMVQASVKVWVALKGLSCSNSAELLGEINRLHCTYGAKKLPMSFWAGYYHPDSGKLDYASAGQSYPLVVDQSGSVVALKQPGMPLGIRIKNQYQMNEIVLNPGQKLILYTDGIVETADKSGKMLGFGGLENLVSSLARVSAGQLISQIFSAAINWGEQNDDRTIVVLSRSVNGDGDADAA
ncbi:MAG: PP2C family protein-serine/threonine phosphatase, partial [Candidatus Riflebacteria bacterium]